MKDEEVRLEEIEVSHTRWNGESRQLKVIRGDSGEGRGEGVDDTLLSYTLEYISLVDVAIICQVGFR